MAERGYYRLAGEVHEDAHATPGEWRISADKSPFTDLAFVTATLNSEKALVNIIGAPEEARLHLRCRDNELTVYISWPGVVSHDMDTLLGDPKTTFLEARFWTDQQQFMDNRFQLRCGGSIHDWFRNQVDCDVAIGTPVGGASHGQGGVRYGH